jgi:hypothetical protein
MDSRGGLRKPQRWNDRNLLEDEPFKTYFLMRSMTSEKRGKNAGSSWDEGIMKEVEKTTGWVRIPPFISVLLS